ncbi:hypothetical protein M409DRAFT_48529 [Zasmidium cellare ATCC 36951]|uniref:Uncharacterized protein n=1 Tax=Zasmidium cellare ATCC 36951 TaxID=1080233 RepID=A0A6A6D2G7_ZASCE|nr:uncharacterized protein M409DRAFT_48529 [Zasmidium cellare ATCC 36951]KAF2173571.1 hypothetical protein M409DRAFT_48529 [Zasmidium cellare ATCC 36951]
MCEHMANGLSDFGYSGACQLLRPRLATSCRCFESGQDVKVLYFVYYVQWSDVPCGRDHSYSVVDEKDAKLSIYSYLVAVAQYERWDFAKSRGSQAYGGAGRYLPAKFETQYSTSRTFPPNADSATLSSLSHSDLGRGSRRSSVKSMAPKLGKMRGIVAATPLKLERTTESVHVIFEREATLRLFRSLRMKWKSSFTYAARSQPELRGDSPTCHALGAIGGSLGLLVWLSHLGGQELIAPFVTESVRQCIGL